MSSRVSLGRGPHVGVGLGVFVEPGQRLGERAAEDVTEVAGFDARDVLDDAEQVRTGRRHRPADVVLRQALELPHQCLAPDLKVPMQVGLDSLEFHGPSMSRPQLRRHRLERGLMITPDGRRLIATRGLRGYADGLVAASLAGYLGDQLGYSATRIGVIVTGMLLGSAVLTMFTGTWGWRFERRALLRAGEC